MKNTLIAFTLLLFISCSKNNNSLNIPEPKDFTAENEAEIVDYISTNNLNAIKTASGLYYVINNLGTGQQPNSSDNVKVAYKGALTDGSVFDESTDGIEFNLQGVIRGWTEGITYFKEGGNGILLIPAHLAYGNRSLSGIPAGSVLVFDINLISVN